MNGIDRYAFVRLSPTGLLLDLESGSLLQLNDSAAFVWQLLCAGSSAAEIAGLLSSRYGIDEARAQGDVAAAIAQAAAAPTSAAVDDFSYQRSPTGYIQSFRGRPILDVDTRGDCLRLVAPASERRPKLLENSLRVIVPKALALRGHKVLHASAVALANRLLVFVGDSGAGKTTLARALVDRGAVGISEDKLVVSIHGGNIMAWTAAEPTIEAWLVRAIVALSTRGLSSCVDLDEAASGSQIQVSEVGYLDICRRRGDRLEARPIGVLKATAELFNHTFLGSDSPTDWRRHLDTAAAMAACVSSYEVTAPSNLQSLSTAASALAARGTMSE